MTTNERFLSILHRVTSCRHLATVNITIWNGTLKSGTRFSMKCTF